MRIFKTKTFNLSEIILKMEQFFPKLSWLLLLDKIFLVLFPTDAKLVVRNRLSADYYIFFKRKYVIWKKTI